jgi:hypothetical protein
MMVVMMVVPMRSRGDPDVTACTMVMVVMMVMSDHNLGSLDAVGLREPFIVGL